MGKRVGAIRPPLPRAPDGSAFLICDDCGVSVAIALVGLHDCKPNPNKDVKRLKREECKGQKTEIPDYEIEKQPRSEFRFFMESFMKTCEAENEIEADRKGFETWKNMSWMERRPYIVQAEKVNELHTRVLLKEENKAMPSVEDEADSSAVGKFAENYRDYEYYDDSDYSISSESQSYVNGYGGVVGPGFQKLLD